MKLHKIITEKIKVNKIIGFDDFMNLALYHPKYGYYRLNKIKIGKSGDFITAPETSDLFGFTLAKQVQQIVENSTIKDGYNILEFGAGNGVMASQILLQLAKNDKLPNYYYILELSKNLIKRQQQNIFAILPELKNRIIWLDKLPNHFDGIIFANEVLDAMPAKRAIINNNNFYELGVVIKNNKFKWQTTTNKINNIKYNLVDGYISEFSFQSNAWIKSLSKITGEFITLLIDYGFNAQEFFHPDRTMGTLRCYQNHQADENPFINIGKKDITTWVNFSAIAEVAKNNGFEILGYATQGLFLISLGIEQFLLSEINESKKIKLANEIKQLVFPNTMGESFKVLVLSKGFSDDQNKNNTINKIKLTGFKEQNLVDRL